VEQRRPDWQVEKRSLADAIQQSVVDLLKDLTVENLEFRAG
jgi:hypothetical protein